MVINRQTLLGGPIPPYVQFNNNNNNNLKFEKMKNELREMSTDFVVSTINSKKKVNRVTSKEFEELIKSCNYSTKIKMRSAFELGRRSMDITEEKRDKITSSKDCNKLLQPILKGLSHEEFFVMYLNHANNIIEIEKMSMGGMCSTVIDIRIIFKKALENKATGIILAHNHPSGNLKPSQPDKEITRKVKRGAETLDITVLDHIIIGQNNQYFSFADEGIL